jgi:hypothetical protein
MVMGRAAGSSFVLNKWLFLHLTLAMDPRFLVADLEHPVWLRSALLERY